MGLMSKKDVEHMRKGAWHLNPTVMESLRPVSIWKDHRVMFDRLSREEAKAKWEALDGSEHTYAMKDLNGNEIARKDKKVDTNPEWWDKVSAPYTILKPTK